MNHYITTTTELNPNIIYLNGDPYISLKGLQEFLGIGKSEMYRKLKQSPRCIFDVHFNPTTLSKENKGKKLVNLRIWREEGLKHSPQVVRRSKRVIDFRPKK